jgi:hypothetical protein
VFVGPSSGISIVEQCCLDLVAEFPSLIIFSDLVAEFPSLIIFSDLVAEFPSVCVTWTL